MSERAELPTYLTVSQFVAKHGWARPGKVRELLFNRHSNGFEECVITLGRRILLDEAKVFAWLRTQNQKECDGFQK